MSVNTQLARQLHAQTGEIGWTPANREAYRQLRARTYPIERVSFVSTESHRRDRSRHMLDFERLYPAVRFVAIPFPEKGLICWLFASEADASVHDTWVTADLPTAAPVLAEADAA